jgi:hypothetical protein
LGAALVYTFKPVKEISTCLRQAKLNLAGFWKVAKTKVPLSHLGSVKLYQDKHGEQQSAPNGRKQRSTRSSLVLAKFAPKPNGTSVIRDQGRP